jgi:hypothetical protein
MDVIFQTGRFCRKQFEVVPLGMKRLFFIGFFFFGVVFFAQPQVALAAAGDACSGDNMGWFGTCQTITTCGTSNADSSASCSAGLICCKGAAGTVSETTSRTDCVGQSVDTVCIAITGQYGRCKAVSGSSSLGCIVDPSYYGGTSSDAAATDTGGTATPCVGGVVRSGICFPADTGLSSAPVGLLLMRLMNWLLAIFGTLAIIAFVISGIQYLVSVGNEEMIETAKRNMWYSIVGIVVALSGWIIIITIDQVLRCSFVFDIGSLTICF